jgi:hypothetical protein
LADFNSAVKQHGSLVYYIGTTEKWWALSVISVSTSYTLEQSEYQLKKAKVYRPKNTNQSDITITVEFLDIDHKYSFNAYLRQMHLAKRVLTFVDKYHEITVDCIVKKASQKLDFQNSGLVQNLTLELMRSEVETTGTHWAHTTNAMMNRLNGANSGGWYASDTLRNFDPDSNYLQHLDKLNALNRTTMNAV